ncbi:MAG: DEAD/DEAH box helicase [Prevotella sp.]|nr:DEAD/DEAH box helicase [Prevotella sp.]
MNTSDLLSRLHIGQLNDMQHDTAAAILDTDGDVVLLSPTGTGKTLAYLLPLLQLVDADSPEPQALVVTPGRELALQSAGVLQSMGSGIRCMACYGGRPAMDEHRQMRAQRPQIVFGTPGRLNDHLAKHNLTAGSIRYLVIDEFDKSLEMGFQADMQRLLTSLPGLERRILLSATKAGQIPQFVNMARRGTLVDYLPSGHPDGARLTLYQVHSPHRDKLDTLRRLLLTLGGESSIVFLNHRDSVERTSSYLQEQGFATARLHGAMEQRQREDMLYQFSNGSASVLVATDLASRGLDIADVGNIVHYHLPESQQAYVHRVGRTARWQATGRTYFILSADEHIPSYIDAHVQTFEPAASSQQPAAPKNTTIYIGKGKKDKISKGDIVGFLCKSAGLTPVEIGRIDVRERYAYAAISRERLPQVLRLAQGAKIKGLKTVVEPVR